MTSGGHSCDVAQDGPGRAAGLLVERVAPVPGTNNVQVCGYLRGSSMSVTGLRAARPAQTAVQ